MTAPRDPRFVQDLDVDDAPAPVYQDRPTYTPPPVQDPSSYDYDDPTPAPVPQPEPVRGQMGTAKEDIPVDEQDTTPVMNEALGIMVVPVFHDGMRLEIPADPEDWPITATRAFENNRIVTAIEGLLSPEDFQKVMKKKYRNKDFGKLYDALAKAGGFSNSGN